MTRLSSDYYCNVCQYYIVIMIMNIISNINNVFSTVKMRVIDTFLAPLCSLGLDIPPFVLHTLYVVLEPSLIFFPLLKRRGNSCDMIIVLIYLKTMIILLILII